MLKTIVVWAALWAALCGLCHGHGHSTLPPSRNGGTVEKAADCLKGECMWFSQPDADSSPAGVHADRTARIPGEPTLNDMPYRTYNTKVSSGPADYTRTSPWRAPGSAPIRGSGCGMAGGGPYREQNGGTAKEFGFPQNMDGKDLPKVAGNATVWKRGSVAEVSWAVNANHGGGYAYRLCKNVPGQNVTEQCFQRGHLDFAGDTQWLQVWDPIKPAPAARTSTRHAIPRITASDGTFPAGSQWTRVPIPACRVTGVSRGWKGCDDDCAGCCATTAPVPPDARINASWWREADCIAQCAGNGLPSSCPAELQFPEPIPGLSSLWSGWLWCDAPRDDAELAMLGDSPHDLPCAKDNMMMYTNIVDHVQIPADLETGDYLLSWRWDSEQTNQVWQNCADVTIN